MQPFAETAELFRHCQLLHLSLRCPSLKKKSPRQRPLCAAMDCVVPQKFGPKTKRRPELPFANWTSASKLNRDVHQKKKSSTRIGVEDFIVARHAIVPP